MTDAAGSLTRQMARQLSITLLDSYIASVRKADPKASAPRLKSMVCCAVGSG